MKTAPLADRPRLGVDYWLWGVVLAASLATIVLFGSYLQNPDARWGRPESDRNTHFVAALRLGLDIRQLDAVQLFDDLWHIRTWPPLHAVVVGISTAIVGANYSLAVLPNVLAWGASLVFIFLLARRLVSQGGNLAGLAAMGLLLGSPSHRAFATDYMLESLGSFLTLLCLYLYVRWRQTPGESLRWLALGLTLLFFEKYNYWMLVVLALVCVELWERRQGVMNGLASLKTGAIWRPTWHTVWAAGSLLLIGLVPAAWLAWEALSDLREGVPIQRHDNVYQFTLIALMVRLAVAWRYEGSRLWGALPAPLKTLAWWHGAPMIVWFLLPKRLGYFIWYLGPTNGVNSDRDLLASTTFYLEQAALWYHATAWVAWLGTLCAVLAVCRLAHLRREAKAVLVFVLISMALTFQHSNQKARNLHTSIPLMWVLSGAGSVAAAQWLLRRQGGLQTAAQWSLAAALAAPAMLVIGSPGASPESGHGQDLCSLALARHYLPWLGANASSNAILATQPMESFAEWTYLVAYPGAPRPLTTGRMTWISQSAASNQEHFEHWMAMHRPAQMVLIEVEDSSPLRCSDFDHYGQINELVRARRDYQEVRAERLTHLGCRISLWQPKDQTATAPKPAAAASGLRR